MKHAIDTILNGLLARWSSLFKLSASPMTPAPTPASMPVDVTGMDTSPDEIGADSAVSSHPQPETSDTSPGACTNDGQENPGAMKIGEFAKREIYAALAEDRVPDDDFGKLLTVEGTKELLGTSLSGFPLFSFSPMIRPDVRHCNSWDEPAVRRGQSVFVNSQWYERQRDKVNDLLDRWNGDPAPRMKEASQTPSSSSRAAHPKNPDSKTDRLDSESVKRYLDDIATHWPEGFDFSAGAMRLLENRCGKMPHGMIRRLKGAMFHPRGRFWFVPDVLASHEMRKAFIGDAQRLLAEYDFVSVPLLATRFDSSEVKLRDDSALEDFVRFLIQTESTFSVEGDGAFVIAQGSESTVKGMLAQFASDVFSFMQERDGNAVPIEEVLEQFPNVDGKTLMDLLSEYEPRLIPEVDAEENLSLKPLASYYLPDDFGDVLTDMIVGMDAAGASPTAAAIATALSEHYSCDFIQNYALDLSYSFKWVITAIWRAGGDQKARSWIGKGARARFVCDDACAAADHTSVRKASKASLCSLVEAAFPDVFTNGDFWEVGEKQYGLAGAKEAKAAQILYLIPRFIRLDRDHWMSVRAFCDAVEWCDAKADAVAGVLRSALGSAPFLPVANLSSSTLDALPGLPFRWTPELIASVAARLVPGVHIVNYGVTSFAMTALLVPSAIPQEGVVPYVLNVYCARNPHQRSIGDAFSFLKENFVRLRLTEQVRQEIVDILEKSEAH